VDQYRVLAAGAGASNGEREPAIDVPASATDGARAMLAERGWDGISPIVGFAPGAAYGGAKRWPPDRVARAIGTLARDRGIACVLVGGTADAATTRAVAAEAGKMSQPVHERRLIDLAGQTDLVRLAAVMSACSVFVSNDSGAMHLAAAVGTPVVAVFGPTNEHATAPVARRGRRATIVTGAAWCRPCGLRECPIDHRCMTSVPVDRVVQAVGEAL
jgi:heptosyltransferase-2